MLRVGQVGEEALVTYLDLPFTSLHYLFAGRVSERRGSLGNERKKVKFFSD